MIERVIHPGESLRVVLEAELPEYIGGRDGLRESVIEDGLECLERYGRFQIAGVAQAWEPLDEEILLREGSAAARQAQCSDEERQRVTHAWSLPPCTS